VKSSPSEDNPEDIEPDSSGSWAQAYREAHGSRRAAMDLLFRTGIIATQDLSLPAVNSTYIEECVEVAAHMLRDKSIEEWVKQWEHAQQTFEDRLSAYYKGQVQDVMAAYEFSDGSWARAYRQSEGQTDRREAFELLLRLGIISPDEFANSLVTPKYIEERISVAMNLLRQKPLSQWVDLCETTHGNFRESVIACFSTQAGGEGVQTDSSPIGQGFPQRSRTPPPARPAGFEEDQTASEKMNNTFGAGSRMTTEPTTIRSPHGKSPRSALSPKSQIPSTAPSGTKSSAFVLPHGPQEPRTLPPTSGVDYGTKSAPMSNRSAPHSVDWPSSGRSMTSSSFGRDRSPRYAEPASAGPAQIKFSNTAISGSSWQAGVTPPGSQRSLGRATPPGSSTPPLGHDKSPRA